MPLASGTVLQLHRWPVKSFAGERADALRLDERGVGGDRTHALFDEFKGAPRRLTARQAPRLLSWSAAYPGAPGDVLAPEAPPEPAVVAPDGRAFAWDDASLAVALAEDLGREVRLHRDVGGQQDRPRTLLVTVQATLEALESELGRPIDVRRFRPNAHLALDAPPFAEEEWAGRRLRIGDAELQIVDPCLRCVIPTRDPDDPHDRWPALLRHLAREHGCAYGVSVRPLGAATIHAGDPVTVS